MIRTAQMLRTLRNYRTDLNKRVQLVNQTLELVERLNTATSALNDAATEITDAITAPATRRLTRRTAQHGAIANAVREGFTRMAAPVGSVITPSQILRATTPRVKHKTNVYLFLARMVRDGKLRREGPGQYRVMA